MKSVLCLILILIVFNSCATRKKAESNLSASSAHVLDEQLIREILSSYQAFSWVKTQSLMDTEIYIRRYDTNREPDSSGRYPLKEEESIRSSYKGESEQEERKEASQEIEELQNRNETVDQNVDVDTVEEISSNIAGGNRWNWLWLLPALFIIIFLYKFFTR